MLLKLSELEFVGLIDFWDINSRSLPKYLEGFLVKVRSIAH